MIFYFQGVESWLRNQCHQCPPNHIGTIGCGCFEGTSTYFWDTSPNWKSFLPIYWGKNAQQFVVTNSTWFYGLVFWLFWPWGDVFHMATYSHNQLQTNWGSNKAAKRENWQDQLCITITNYMYNINIYIYIWTHGNKYSTRKTKKTSPNWQTTS